MNAAARLVHQGVLSRHLILTQFLSRKQITLLVPAFAILFSLLSIIYMTHTTRILHANYQHELVEQSQLELKHGQLLLERSTWMMQARIQQIAEKELGMMVPGERSVVVINE